MPFTAIPRIPALVGVPERKDQQGRVISPPKVYVNAAKNQVKPFVTTLDTDAISLGASAQRDYELRAPAEENLLGDFEVAQIVSQHSGRYTAEIFHSETDRAFQSRPVHVGCFAGSAQLPFELWETFFVQAGGVSRVRLVNLETVTNTIRTAWKGRRFLGYAGYAGFTREEILLSFARRHSHPYWLGTVTSPFTLTASQSRSNQPFTLLTGEADFEVDSILYVASQGPGSIAIEIREGTSGRIIVGGNSTNGTVPANLVGGNAYLPAKLPDTWLIKRNTQVAMFVDELTGAANEVYIYLHGRLLYDDEPGGKSVHTIPIPMAAKPIGVGWGGPRR